MFRALPVVLLGSKNGRASRLTETPFKSPLALTSGRVGMAQKMNFKASCSARALLANTVSGLLNSPFPGCKKVRLPV